jgi:hypothetical protein
MTEQALNRGSSDAVARAERLIGLVEKLARLAVDKIPVDIVSPTATTTRSMRFTLSFTTHAPCSASTIRRVSPLPLPNPHKHYSPNR